MRVKEKLSIRVVIFDIDDTLTDDGKSRKGAYKEVCKRLNMECLEEDINKFISYDNNFWIDHGEGKIKIPNNIESSMRKKWFRAQRFIHNFKNIDLKTAIELNDIYCSSLANHVVMIDHADEVVKYLSQKYKLVIATNGPSVTAREKLEKIGVLGYFDNVIVAEEIGVDKPKEEFFYKLMDEIDYYDPSKMAIIGDSITSDINGGIAMGMFTYWLNNKNSKEKVKCTAEISSLAQLFDLL